MKEYHNALQLVLEKGKLKQNRTGVDTLSVFGHQMRFDLRDKFPAVTTKKLAWYAVVSELLWMLEGSTDERRLAEIYYEDTRFNLTHKQTIWTKNADNQGRMLGYTNNFLTKELGPVYGSRWRKWDSPFWHIDQIKNVLNTLKKNPDSRRHIVSAWDPANIENMALPPCHILFQFYVQDNELSCQFYQRSADLPLGSPFNIAAYGLLTYMFARILNMTPGDLIYTIGDMHVYVDQIEAVKLQLSRSPYPSPSLIMPKFSTLDELLKTTPSEYTLVNYQHYPAIKINMAV